jgi:NADPH-dependent 2,4-dienoyl-CoA reductase/sulfur reductase-like enzyme
MSKASNSIRISLLRPQLRLSARLLAALCLGVAASSTQAGPIRYQPAVEKLEPRALDCDVAVYGGTPAGVTAAVQAARLGKSVIFISFNGFVGGMTSGGLTATDLGDKETIGGMALEFYQRVGGLKGFRPSKAEEMYRK